MRQTELNHRDLQGAYIPVGLLMLPKIIQHK